MASNRINVSVKRRLGAFVARSRELLKEETSEIELHGVGKAIISCIRVADMLSEHEYANIGRIDTMALKEEGQTNPRPKIVVTMIRALTFYDAYDRYEATVNQAKTAGEEKTL